MSREMALSAWHLFSVVKVQYLTNP
jgi:hypothetical protein